MSLRNIDISAALTRLAERRIEEAMEQGKFDNLQGAGKPIDLEPIPAEENARMMWWAMRLFRHNNIVPDEVRYRREIETCRTALAQATSEQRATELVVIANEAIHRLNTMGTNIKASDYAPLDLSEELERWREHRSRP
jgi:hypothetical protein